MDPTEKLLMDYDWRMDLKDHLQDCINQKERKIESLRVSIASGLLKRKKKRLADEEVKHLEKRVAKMTERRAALQVETDSLAEEYQRQDVNKVHVNYVSLTSRAYKLSKDLEKNVALRYGGGATDAELKKLKNYCRERNVPIHGLREAIKYKGY